MRKKTQYIVVNEIYKTIYCGYPQKRAWKIITGSSGGMLGEVGIIFICTQYMDMSILTATILKCFVLLVSLGRQFFMEGTFMMQGWL